MNDQELSGGAPAPDANASQVTDVADAATPKPGSEADSSPAAKEPSDSKPNAWEERLKEVTRHRREAERRADRLARENEELRRSYTPPPRPQAQQPQAQPQSQLSTNPTELGELAAQEARRILQEREARDRRARFDEKVDEFASEVEDYDAVVTDRTPVSDRMAEAIMDSDSPGELLYYLGKNPEVARKLFDLPLTKAAKEIGRIEDRLAAERKKAAEKPVSQAPPPAPQIEAKESSSRVSTTSPDSDSLSDEEWVKAENARLRRKAKRNSE